MIHSKESQPERGLPPTIYPLRPAAGEGSVVFLPDIGGSVLYARRILSRLEPQLGVYGLCLDADLLRDLSRCTLTDIARRFAADLQAAGLSKPFHLVGHCFAGFLAFETACELSALDARIGVVALLDCSLPSRFYAGWAYQWRATLRHANQRLHHLLERAPGLRRGDDPSLQLRVPGFIHVDLSKYPESYRYIIRHLFQAMLDYEPGVYHGRLTLFRAMDRHGLAVAPMDLGWSPFASDGVTVIELPGHQYDVVKNDGAAERLAARLNPILSESGLRAS